MFLIAKGSSAGDANILSLSSSVLQLSPEAKKLLVESYVALRRGDTTPGTRVAYRMTVRQLEALIRLSEAIARSHLEILVRLSLNHFPCLSFILQVVNLLDLETCYFFRLNQVMFY